MGHLGACLFVLCLSSPGVFLTHCCRPQACDNFAYYGASLITPKYFNTVSSDEYMATFLTAVAQIPALVAVFFMVDRVGRCVGARGGCVVRTEVEQESLASATERQRMTDEQLQTT